MSNDMGKASYTLKIQAVLMRESGKSIRSICRELGIQYTSLILWLSLYKNGGERSLSDDAPIPQKSIEEKISIVEDILNNNLSLNGAVVKHMLSKTCLKTWIKAYKEYGPSGLERKHKHQPMSKKKREYSPEELDELTELRRRNEWLEAENAMLKKAKALVEAKRAQQRANGQESSKN
jgi:transposase-like protein